MRQKSIDKFMESAFRSETERKNLDKFSVAQCDPLLEGGYTYMTNSMCTL